MTIQQKPKNDFGSTEFSPDGSVFDAPVSGRHLPFEHRKRKRSNFKYKIISAVFVLALFAAIGYGSFFVYKIYSVGKKVSIEAGGNSSFLETLKSFTGGNQLNLKGAQTGRINILLMGIAGEGKPGQFLTDTIMVASLDTKNNRVALLSIPRDLYVEVPGTQHLKSKINSIYQFGLGSTRDDEASGAELIKKTISNITT